MITFTNKQATTSVINAWFFMFKCQNLYWYCKLFNLCLNGLVRGWKHTTGGPNCCHIVLFSRGVHVWTLAMVILEHIFSNFLHNMVDYNTKNSITKKILFSNLYCEVPKYICGKTMYITMYKKCKYTQKMIEMIFSLYEICNIY
jgi:hypothetical protein